MVQSFFLNPGQELKVKFSREKKITPGKSKKIKFPELNNLIFNPGQELKIKFSRV